ncbi:PHD finger protein 11 isoform 2-T2 [Discoglossus pictus]
MAQNAGTSSGHNRSPSNITSSPNVKSTTVPKPASSQNVTDTFAKTTGSLNVNLELMRQRLKSKSTSSHKEDSLVAKLQSLSCMKSASGVQPSNLNVGDTRVTTVPNVKDIMTAKQSASTSNVSDKTMSKSPSVEDMAISEPASVPNIIDASIADSSNVKGCSKCKVDAKPTDSSPIKGMPVVHLLSFPTGKGSSKNQVMERPIDYSRTTGTLASHFGYPSVTLNMPAMSVSCQRLNEVTMAQPANSRNVREASILDLSSPNAREASIVDLPSPNVKETSMAYLSSPKVKESPTADPCSPSTKASLVDPSSPYVKETSMVNLYSLKEKEISVENPSAPVKEPKHKTSDCIRLPACMCGLPKGSRMEIETSQMSFEVEETSKTGFTNKEDPPSTEVSSKSSSSSDSIETFLITSSIEGRSKGLSRSIKDQATFDTSHGASTSVDTIEICADPHNETSVSPAISTDADLTSCEVAPLNFSTSQKIELFLEYEKIMKQIPDSGINDLQPGAAKSFWNKCKEKNCLEYMLSRINSTVGSVTQKVLSGDAVDQEYEQAFKFLWASRCLENELLDVKEENETSCYRSGEKRTVQGYFTSR